jgi:hypothetical protein
MGAAFTVEIGAKGLLVDGVATFCSYVSYFCCGEDCMLRLFL